MNDITNPLDHLPRRDNGLNAGAVSIEQERAIAEARGQIQLAKMFPRSIAEATAELVEACKSPEFAAAAFYSVPNRGSGPSIRFAEEVARCYGNFEYGHRELSRSEGKSEIEVFAWDKQKNNYSKRQITVLHVRDTKNGSYPLRDQADIDNRIANVASKQMRGRILALLPKSMVQLGIEECKKTLAGGNQQSIGQRVQKMVSAFAGYGVTPANLSAYLGHSIDNCSADDLTDLVGVFNALREGARVADYFEQLPNSEPVQKLPGAANDNKPASIAAAVQQAAAEQPEPEPEPEAAPAPKKTRAAKKPEPKPEPEPLPDDAGPDDYTMPAGDADLF